MEFRYSSEHDAFRESIARFLREACPPARVRAVAAGDGHDSATWQRLCGELGLPALHAPPEYGGAGGTLIDTAIAFGELGRALTPVPLAATVFAIEAVLRLGDGNQRARLLAGLLSGERIGAFAAAGADVAATVRAGGPAGRPVLTGECAPVLHGHVADLFIVPAAADGEIVLHVVAATAPGVHVARLPSFDTTRPVARLQLTRAPAEPLAAGSTADVDRVLDVARVLLAAEMLGGAEACLDTAVEYARNRRQFDRPIGSFQAVKHACAEMLIEVDATRVAVMFAAMSAADTHELRVTAPLVKAQAADTYALCVGSAMQVHGGIAFTWEHALHLYFRRAKTTAALFGDSARQRELLADRAVL